MTYHDRWREMLRGARQDRNRAAYAVEGRVDGVTVEDVSSQPDREAEALTGWARPDRVCILMYHSISPQPTATRFRQYCVSPALFSEHLAALWASGLAGTTTSGLLAAQAEQRTSAVALTFDDAFADFADHAAPALASAGMTGTVYIPTGYVGKRASWLASVGESGRPLLDWAALRDLSAAGIECASHGHEHIQLDAVPLASAEADIRASQAALEAHLGIGVRSFSYPFGYYDRRVVDLVRRLGFDSACGVGYGTNPRAGLDRYRLRRIFVSADMTPEELLRRLLTRPSKRLSEAARVYTRPLWRVARRLNHSFRCAR